MPSFPSQPRLAIVEAASQCRGFSLFMRAWRAVLAFFHPMRRPHSVHFARCAREFPHPESGNTNVPPVNNALDDQWRAGSVVWMVQLAFWRYRSLT